MDLTKRSNEELYKELNRRQSIVATWSETEDKPVLVVGTICDYPEGPMIELFNKVEKPEDLPSKNYYLRTRLNAHRNYRLFYFKTDSYADLEKQLNEDPQSVSDWVMERESINKVYI